jgi:hypothetical protein
MLPKYVIYDNKRTTANPDMTDVFQGYFEKGVYAKDV